MESIFIEKSRETYRAWFKNGTTTDLTRDEYVNLINNLNGNISKKLLIELSSRVVINPSEISHIEKKL